MFTLNEPLKHRYVNDSLRLAAFKRGGGLYSLVSLLLWRESLRTEVVKSHDESSRTNTETFVMVCVYLFLDAAGLFQI